MFRQLNTFLHIGGKIQQCCIKRGTAQIAGIMPVFLQMINNVLMPHTPAHRMTVIVENLYQCSSKTATANNCYRICSCQKVEVLFVGVNILLIEIL